MPDAIVVGGGIIGLLSARALSEAGMNVTLLERGQPGREASWASAGIIGARTPLSRLPSARLNSLSVGLWPKLAAELRDETGMDVEYRENGVLVPAFSDDEARALREEIPAIRAGAIDAEFVDGAALREAEPALGPAVVAAQLLPGGNVENRRVCRALEISLARRGVRVVTGAAVVEVTQRSGQATGVRTTTEQIGADVVVLAAGSWSASIAGISPRIPVVPQRGEILALMAPNVRLRRVVMITNDPYLVPRADGRIIVGATRTFVGFDRSFTAGGAAWLLASAIQMAPALAACPIAEMWTGFRPLSPDNTPIIGPSEVGGLYYATGHGPSGVGPAPGTVALLKAQVLGEPPPVPPEPFSPARFASAQVV